MESDANMEDSTNKILSKLQSSADLTGIHALFTAHLHPFTPFLLNKPSKSKSSSDNSHKTIIRSLAKQYLYLLHNSLSLLPKRLSNSPKIPKNCALELLDAYRLCLSCLNLISPELSGKPYAVEAQRVQYLHCLERWELYGEAEVEGFALLDGFCGRVGNKGRSRRSKARLVPESDEENVDQEFVLLILEIVVTLVQCGSKRRSKLDADYWRVIALVNESEPWFKILDAKNYEKFHRFLVTNLHITAVSLVADLKCLDVDLICEFTLVTFKEYKKSSVPEQMNKFVHKICSALFSQKDELSSDIIIDVVKYVWDFMAAECKVGVEKTVVDFLELVCYCANKCYGANVNLCGAVAEHLYRLADSFHEGFPFISSILTLYGTGLLASSSADQSKVENKENCRNSPLGSILQLVRDNKERLQRVVVSLDLLKSHFDVGNKEKNSDHKGMSHASAYWEALRYLSQSLAEFITSNRKEFFSETEHAFAADILSSIHDVFHQFSYIFLQCLSETERERETSGDNHRVISSTAVAALMLSLKTNQNMKKSTLLVKHVISAQWVPVKRLKYLYVSLNNIAIILNRQKRLKEAIKALKLCCKASWSYLVYLSETHANKSEISRDDLSEKVIADFVKEASERTAFFLELSQECNCKINGVIEEIIKCWSIAENSIADLPTPAALVKEWVKIEYILSKDAEKEHGTTLYSLLPSSTRMCKRALGKLLEQELFSYHEKSHLNPGFCYQMQIEIFGVLLEDIYVTKESNLKRSRILIEKGKVLKAHGLARLDECTQCLSDAILTLKSIFRAKKSCNPQVHHLLIQAYIMHALFTQEALPNSTVLSHRSVFLRDINDAVKLFLSPDHEHGDKDCEKSEDLLYLWYQLIDLLSIKGYLELHPSLYDVVIKLCDQKSFSLAKTVSKLWKNKRLSHALCTSPVNHMFVETFSKKHSQLCSSAEFWKACMGELSPLVVGFHQVDNEIKQAALDLASRVPLSSCSVYLSSHLYYDLSGRLISSGRMIEALSYAKEAQRLRSILLQQKFKYAVEKVTEKFDENGDIIEKSYYGIQTFRVKDPVGAKVSHDYEECHLTPWNVLTCYLESILQVGVIEEILGNGSEAEMLLQWGRNVSQFQGLPIFEISYSCALGKLYRKQKLWCMAEKELCSAKKALTINHDVISCEKCANMLEISLNQQLGDLFLSSSCSSGKLPFTKRLFNAKSLYRSALDKLNLYEWSDSMSEDNRAEKVSSSESSTSCCASNLLEAKDSLSTVESDLKIEPKRYRRKAKEPKPAKSRHDMVGGQNRRITRSTYRSLEETHKIVPSDEQIGINAGLATEHLSTSAASSNHIVLDSEAKCSTSDLKTDITYLCNKMKCWPCLHTEAVHCSSLKNFINMNWELVYRKLSLRLLVSIGKFSGICGDYHEAHELLLQGISVFFSRNSLCSKHSSSSVILLIETIGKTFFEDVIAVERAVLLYYICWFSLKSYPCQSTRNVCCELSCIGTARIVSLLKLAFILCREVPSLFQKIARLLAVLYVLSTSVKSFSLAPSEEGSESRWASFFHQASLGTHLNQQMYSDMVLKRQSPIASVSEGSLLPNSTETIVELLESLRLAPDLCEDLEEFVLRFFQDLPGTPIICISLIADADADLLRELLHISTTVRAWMLLSHLSSDNQHVVLLPVHTTLEEASDNDDGTGSIVPNSKDFVKRWKCPWASSLIDDVAPVFRHIMEGNYYSSSDYFVEYTKQNPSLWWMQRNRLDECLSKFLQDMEDLWLGTWKCLLLGEWPHHSCLDSVQKKLFGDEQSLQYAVNKKCVVGLRSDLSSSTSGQLENMMQLLYKRRLERSHELDQVESMDTKPIVLVLDFEIQMLPWENLPVLRNQEVYRMPSVGSIFATMNRCCQNQEKIKPIIPALPLIDPLDSFYLLNPDGDLSRTQADFENWFKDQNMEVSSLSNGHPTIEDEYCLNISFFHLCFLNKLPIQGKAGSVPTVEELALALKNHDLFIYFGHGSGMQYIPGHEIEKLDSCAATLLMGCSSGSLYRKGCYIPHGAPISYLMAGSPVTVANLWEVTDKDIDRFGKAMLNAWLRERATKCEQCAVSLNDRESRNCRHRPRIGSFMGKARDACTLGYLIGASPVCYGVPTGIIKRKNV